MMSKFVYAAPAALIMQFCCNASYSCSNDGKCNSRWGAAQDVGVQTSFLTMEKRSSSGADIKVGNALVAQTDIYVHPRPGKWLRLDILKTGQTVTVEAISLQNTTDGPQVWVQIRPTPDYVRTAMPAQASAVSQSKLTLPAAATAQPEASSTPTLPG